MALLQVQVELTGHSSGGKRESNKMVSSQSTACLQPALENFHHTGMDAVLMLARCAAWQANCKWGDRGGLHPAHHRLRVQRCGREAAGRGLRSGTTL